MKTNKSIYLTLLIALILVLLFKTVGQTDSTIKIGWQGPLSGQAASYGEVIKTATQIAVDEINSTGGINGKMIEMVYDDDQCTAQGAISASKKQTEVDKVQASITSACSPSALASAPIFEASKTSQIIYCAASPAIAKSGDYIFRINPSDKILASKMAEYIYKDLDKKRVAILYVNNDWGVSLKDDFISEAKKLGKEVILVEAHNQDGNFDIKTSISKIAEAKPDAVLFASYPTGIILGMKQIEQQKLNAVIIGAGASWDSGSTWEKIGPVTRDISFFAPKVSDKSSLAEKVKAKTGQSDIFSCAYYSYDAVKVLASALAKSDSLTGESLNDALYKTSINNSISQPSIKFDTDGELVNPQYEVKKILNNKIISY